MNLVMDPNRVLHMRVMESNTRRSNRCGVSLYMVHHKMCGDVVGRQHIWSIAMHAAECLLVAGAQVHLEDITPSLCVTLESRAFGCVAVFVRLVWLGLACNGAKWFAMEDTHLNNNAAS
jgi:hypothetical protein